MKPYWKDIPLGIIKNDQLLARCIALAELRPNFAPAFDALLKAESLELHDAWLKYYQPPQAAMVILPANRLIEG